MDYYAQLFLNGLVAGSVYALFAVGLTMVYGVFRFINFAHGELIAWGAYVALFFSRPPFSLPIYLAGVPAVAVTALIALAQDRYIYSRLRGGDRITLLIASIGLSYLLRNILRLIWGSDLQTYGLPPTRGIAFAGLSITITQIAIITAAIFFLGILYIVLTRTLLGKCLRAVADNLNSHLCRRRWNPAGSRHQHGTPDGVDKPAESVCRGSLGRGRQCVGGPAGRPLYRCGRKYRRRGEASLSVWPKISASRLSHRATKTSSPLPLSS